MPKIQLFFRLEEMKMYYDKQNILKTFEMKKGFDDINILYDCIEEEFLIEKDSKNLKI